MARRCWVAGDSSLSEMSLWLGMGSCACVFASPPWTSSTRVAMLSCRDDLSSVVGVIGGKSSSGRLRLWPRRRIKLVSSVVAVVVVGGVLIAGVGDLDAMRDKSTTCSSYNYEKNMSQIHIDNLRPFFLLFFPLRLTDAIGVVIG